MSEQTARAKTFDVSIQNKFKSFVIMTKEKEKKEKREKQAVKLDERLLVNTVELMQVLGCGKPTAIQIGTAAKAKVFIGDRKLLWNVEIIRKYLNDIAE